MNTCLFRVTEIIFYLLKQFKLEWHLLLHNTLFFKHAQCFVWHFVNPWPPVGDSMATAPLMISFVLTSPIISNRWGHRSNWFLEYLPLRIPDGHPIVYWPLSSILMITLRMFLGLSTDGMGIATLSPSFPSAITTRLRLTILSACWCCASRAGAFWRWIILCFLTFHWQATALTGGPHWGYQM